MSEEIPSQNNVLNDPCPYCNSRSCCYVIADGKKLINELAASQQRVRELEAELADCPWRKEALESRPKIAKLQADLDAAKSLLKDFVGVHGECDHFDHHGFCQTHFLDPKEKCPVKIAKDFLDGREAVPAGGSAKGKEPLDLKPGPLKWMDADDLYPELIALRGWKSIAIQLLIRFHSEYEKNHIQFGKCEICDFIDGRLHNLPPAPGVNS